MKTINNKKDIYIEVVQIPTMDISFMDSIMEGGIADSSFESNRDIFYNYANKNQNETTEQRLVRFGFDVEKIKEWSF